MMLKINLVSGILKITHLRGKKAELIKFEGVVCRGNNEAELKENFVFERIRGTHKITIQKALKENRLKIQEIKIVKDLGFSNLE